MDAALKQMRTIFAERLATHDRAITRLREVAASSTDFTADVALAAECFLNDHETFHRLDEKWQGLLAMFAHRAVTEFMLSVLERREEIEACGK